MVYSCDFNNNQPPKTSKWQIYDKNTDIQTHIYVPTHVPEKAQNEPKLLELKQRLTKQQYGVESRSAKQILHQQNPTWSKHLVTV